MRSDLRRNDPLPPAVARQRLALVAARPDADAAALGNALRAAREDEDAFVTFVADNGLGPVWRQALQSQGFESRLSPRALETLTRSRRSAATSYLLQEAAIREIDEIFTARGVAYAVIKGAHVRELVYGEPALRPCLDIDLLVGPKDRAAAAAALAALGFVHYREPETVSHEAVFSRAALNVDLHWDILRPGRTRIDVAETFVANRRRCGWFWGLDETHATFLMLVHPAFTKYVSSPNMELARVMDALRWMERRAIDWSAVAALLAAAGVKTAAWTVLLWFDMLGLETPANVMAQIAPGGARAAYLRYWLEHELTTRWLDRNPLLIQLGLTLALHDRPSDAGRALAGWSRAYLQRQRKDDDFMRT